MKGQGVEEARRLSVLCVLKSCASCVRASMIPVRGPGQVSTKSVLDAGAAWYDDLRSSMSISTSSQTWYSITCKQARAHRGRRGSRGREREGGKGGKARASDSGILNQLTLTLYLAHRPPLSLRKTAASHANWRHCIGTSASEHVRYHETR